MKERKLYPQKGKYVVTWESKVYVQPETFKPVTGQTIVNLAKSPGDGDALVDDDGGVWMLLGENKACGVRCPKEFKAFTGSELADELESLTQQTRVKLMSMGHDVALNVIWRDLSHAERREIVTAIDAPVKRVPKVQEEEKSV